MLKEYLILTSVFLWAGCIIAISFVESWLKFRAAGVTVPVGLSIGKLVFSALNKMEWVFAAIILISYLLDKKEMSAGVVVWFALAFWVVIVQTFWLLPALDVRANAVINGKTLAPSSLHWYYVAAEVVKLSSLFVLGFQLFKMFVASN